MLRGRTQIGRLFRTIPAITVFLMAGRGVTASPPVPRAPSNITYDEEYDVFYQEAFHALMPRVKAAIPRAYQTVIKAWNLDYPGLLHPLTVQLKQLPDDNLVRQKVAYVQARGAGNDLRQVMVFDLGAYKQFPEENIEEIATHEMGHVVLQDVESGPHTAPIPSWLNEGLAQSIDQEGKERLENDVETLRRTGAPLVLCQLDEPVDEFFNGPFNLNSGCYPEFYLAVQRLKQLGGPRTISRLMAGLRDGKTLADQLPALAGMDWNAFQREVTRYSEDVFNGRQPIP